MDVKPLAPDLGAEWVLDKLRPHARLQHSPQPSSPGPRWPPLDRGAPSFLPRKAKAPSLRRTQHDLMTVGPGTGNPLTPRGSPSPLQEEWELLLENLIGGPHVPGTVLHQVLARATGRRWVGSHPTTTASLRVRSGSSIPRVRLGVCHSPPPRAPLQHHTWKFSRMSFILPLTNSSRGSFSKEGPPT